MGQKGKTLSYENMLDWLLHLEKRQHKGSKAADLKASEMKYQSKLIRYNNIHI